MCICRAKLFAHVSHSELAVQLFTGLYLYLILLYEWGIINKCYRNNTDKREREKYWKCWFMDSWTCLASFWKYNFVVTDMSYSFLKSKHVWLNTVYKRTVCERKTKFVRRSTHICLTGHWHLSYYRWFISVICLILKVKVRFKNIGQEKIKLKRSISTNWPISKISKCL